MATQANDHTIRPHEATLRDLTAALQTEIVDYEHQACAYTVADRKQNGSFQRLIF